MDTKEKRKRIAAAIDMMPENLLDELDQFINQLKAKDISDVTDASEQVLAKDWNLPEEEEAWQDL